MRVIHVSAYYAPADVYGGPVRSIHALCKAQQAHGLDLEVFTTTANGVARLVPAPEGRLFDGVPVRYFDVAAPAFLLGGDGLAESIARALRGGVDVVHLHGLFNRTVWNAARVLREHQQPFVLSPRGMLEPPALAHHRWRKRIAWHLKDQAVVRSANLLHATAAPEADTLRRAHAGRRVVAIPNPVDSLPVDAQAGLEWRRENGIPLDAPLVLALGRLHRIKRLDLVADAFMTLRARSPHAHLVIAGPDEHHLRPILEARLAAAPRAVHWPGAVDDRAKHVLLSAATVLVQCSDSESFGMSVAEALASGTPVVVTRTCPWREVEEWGCGFWTEQTPEAVATALHAVVANPALAEEQGRAGQRLVKARFSPAGVAAAWRSAYQGICQSTPAAA